MVGQKGLNYFKARSYTPFNSYIGLNGKFNQGFCDKITAEPDRLIPLSSNLPVVGNEINILPILMAITMFVQQKISMVKATGEAAQQQKMMSIIMPIMFGVIFYQMPSGLVLYWFVNSALMLFYQIRMNRQK